MTVQSILKKTFSIAFICGVLNSCSTIQNGYSLSNMFSSDSDKVVVQKAGSKLPILSPYGKKHWYEARQSAKSEIKRIQAILATGDYRSAEKSARVYLEKMPGDLDGLTVLSSALAMRGKYQLAAYYAKLISKKMPNNAYSLNLQGLAILMQASHMSEYKRAQKLFRQSFENSNKEIAAGLNLGNLYLDLGNVSAALGIFEETSNRCNNCTPALLGYGIAAKSLRKYPEAQDSFESILEKEPNNPHALVYLAEVYDRGLNDRNNAIKFLNKAIASNNTPHSLKNYAYIQLRNIKSRSKAYYNTAKNKEETPDSSLSLDEEEVESKNASFTIPKD